MSAEPSVEPGARAGRREWTGLAVLAGATLLLSLDLSVLYLALPALSNDLQASATEQLWILDIYGFMIAGFLITMGTLGDRIGRRKLLLIGATVFAIASVGAAFSVSPEMLIASRAAMGIAGATVMPSCLALITNMFHDPVQRGMAISAWMSCFMVGMLIGPLIGGLMLEFFWWGSVFLLGVPVMVVLLIAAPRTLPEFSAPNPGKLDLLSVFFSLAAMLPIVYGIKELAKRGWETTPIVAIAVGVLFAVVFLVRQRRLTHPLIDLRVFSSGIVVAVLALGLFGSAVQGGSSLLVTLDLQMVEGLSALGAGLWLIPPTLAMIIGLMVGPGLAQKIRPGLVITAGLPIAVIGYLLLTQVEPGGLTLLLIGWSVVLFGVAIPMGLGTSIGMAATPPEQAGSVSGVLQAGNEFGVALGIAVLGSITAAIYRGDVVVPAGIPPEAADAAKESITGGVAVANQIPGQAGQDLLASAREAFTSGLSTSVIVCVAVMVVMAGLSIAFLRKIDPMTVTPQAEAGAVPAGGPAVDADNK